MCPQDGSTSRLTEQQLAQRPNRNPQTAAARINGITIHSACNFSKDTSRTSSNKDIDGVRPSKSAELSIGGRARMDWQEKYQLIVDEVRMLGARVLYAVNEQLQVPRLYSTPTKSPNEKASECLPIPFPSWPSGLRHITFPSLALRSFLLQGGIDRFCQHSHQQTHCWVLYLQNIY
jgi:hypothetical protein